MSGQYFFFSVLLILLFTTLDAASSSLEDSQKTYPQEIEYPSENSEDDVEIKENLIEVPYPSKNFFALFTPEANIGYSENNGPNTWPARFPAYCAGIRQSGIDITLANAVSLPTGTNPVFSQINYDVTPLSMSLVNKGLSIYLTGTWPADKLPKITLPGVTGEYGFAEIHFHWGKNWKEGSEHTLNGRSFPLEMHVVHYKLQYGSLKAAVSQSDGLAVVGYLFELQKQRNPALWDILSASVQIRNPQNPPVAITPFAVNQLAPTFTSNYVSYLGSLTIPNCNEVVTWIVNLNTLRVSRDQLLLFRQLRNTDGRFLLANFRPVQPLNGRTITYVP